MKIIQTNILIIICLTITLAAQAQKPELIRQMGHSEGVTAMTFSPNGKLLATVGGDKTVCLWDVQTRRELRQFTGLERSTVEFLAFSPDNRLLAVKDGDAARVWNVMTGKSAGVIESIESSFAFSPDGRSLISAFNVTGTFGCEIRRLSVGDWKVLSRVKLAEQCVLNDKIVSPSGKLLAVSETEYDDRQNLKNQHIKFYNAATAQLIKIVKVKTDSLIEADTMAFSGDDKYLIFAGRNVWTIIEIASGKLLPSPIKSDTFQNTSGFSPNSKILITEVAADKNSDGYLTTGNLQLWNLETGAASRIIKARAFGVNAFAFSPDGKILVGSFSVTDNNNVVFWNADSGTEIGLLKNGQEPVKVVKFNAENNTVLSGNKERAKIWDVFGRSEPRAIPGNHGLSNDFGLSANQNWAAQFDSRDLHNVHIDDLETGKEVLRYQHPRSLSTFALSPDARTLAVATDEIIKLISLKLSVSENSTLDPGGEPIVHGLGEVSDLIFSPNGKLLLSSSTEGTKVWDTATKNLLYTLKNEPDVISTKRFSPDSKILATVELLGQMKFWNAETGAELKTLPGHTASGIANTEILAMTFSKDGKIFATGGVDKTVRLWDVKTGQMLKVFSGFPADVTALDFDSQTARLLTGCGDGTILLFNVSTGDKSISFFDLGDDWLAVTPDGLFDGSPNAWKVLSWRLSENLYDIAPVEAFFSEYHRPGLLSDVFENRKIEKPTRDTWVIRPKR